MVLLNLSCLRHNTKSSACFARKGLHRQMDLFSKEKMWPISSDLHDACVSSKRSTMVPDLEYLEVVKGTD